MAHILIIGGGMAGLSAGIYAAQNGHKATILEKHARTGGNLTGWDRQGYHIDNCIHWLTGTNPATGLHRMWQELGALDGTEILQTPSLYTYTSQGQSLCLTHDLEKLEQDLLAVSPEDREPIRDFTASIRVMQYYLGIGGAGHREEKTGFGLLPFLPRFLRLWRQDVGDLIRPFRSSLIRGFLSSLLTERFGALALIMVFATYTGNNGDLPAGGSTAMAERITGRFLSLGGELFCRKEAVDIRSLRKEVRVTLQDGQVITGDYVIVTADPAVAFPKLLKKEVPRPFARRYRDPALARFSCLHLAFACDLPALPFCGSQIFSLSPGQRESLASHAVILREFSHEPSFAPEGKSLLQVMLFCSETTARFYLSLAHRPEEYRREKQRLQQETEAVILEHLPSLAGHLHLLDCWTPATYQRFTGAEMGSFMGFPLRKKHSLAPIDNRTGCPPRVILATQWLEAPGGLPMAARAGKEAVRTMLRREKRRLWTVPMHHPRDTAHDTAGDTVQGTL